jgi:hypothetical protein
MTFKIRATKDGEPVETVRIGPTAIVAKARGLFGTGWVVQIIDNDGSVSAPSEFDQLFSFDRSTSPKESPRADVLAMLESIFRRRK